MEKLIIFSCMLAVSSAIFFPFLNFPKTGQSMMNVCIYASDPTRYQPKCFLCPSTVYTNVLQACLNAAAIPRNISYAQARCLEQNCAINRGKRSVDTQQPENLLEEFGTRLPLDGEDSGNEKNGGEDTGHHQRGNEDTRDLQNGENMKDQQNDEGKFKDQQNDEEEVKDQQNGDEEDTGDQQISEEDVSNGFEGAQHGGYKIIGTEEFMASDEEDYSEYSDMVD